MAKRDIPASETRPKNYSCKRVNDLLEENIALRTKVKEREAGYGQLLKSANIDAHRMAEWGEDLRGVLEKVAVIAKRKPFSAKDKTELKKLVARALKGDFDDC